MLFNSLIRPARSVFATLAIGLLSGLPASLSLFVIQPSTAHAQVTGEEDLQNQKEYWQDRYRRLRQDAARLERNAERARKAYALAQRRNYPRGGARQQLFQQIEDAETELESVRKEIAELPSEARRAGAMPGWLYEVEKEEVVIPEPAAPDSSELAADDCAGRNPIYCDQGDGDDEDDF
jgi:hypothetical protein